jgi:hypothetical protein
MVGIWQIIISKVRLKLLKIKLYTINTLLMSKKNVTPPKDEKEIVGQASKIDLDKATKSPALEALIESTRVMELVKSQFGYSGYSNPNYIALEKAIENNKKLIDGK